MLNNELKTILCCSACRGELFFEKKSVLCLRCRNTYSLKNDIPVLFPPRKDELISRYRACYDKIAEDDLKDPLDPLEKNKELRNIPFKTFIGDVSNRSILDIGAGPGIFLNMIEGKFKVAFDMSLSYLNAARQKNLVAVAGDAEALPFKDHSFDIVICSAVLEHVLNPDKVINGIKRVLKPGGKLYVVVPWKEDLSKYKAFEGIYEFTHLRTFDEASIKGLLRAFTIKRMKGIIAKTPFFQQRQAINSAFNIKGPHFAKRMEFKILYKTLKLIYRVATVCETIRIKIFGPILMMIEAQ